MRKLFIALAALALPLQAAAQGAPDVEFSATAVQSMPENRTMTGKLYNGKGKVRQEMSQEGQTRVTISDMTQGVTWILNPDRKEYVEIKTQGGGPQAGPAGRVPLPDDPSHPCQQAKAGLKCTKLGSEVLGGRQTDKWEVIATQGEETLQSQVWIDQRLRMPIRMEMPGGMASELRDIKEGPQAPELFSVPADYKRVELPQRGPQGAGQPGPGMGTPPR
jgi:hypothetical protein